MPHVVYLHSALTQSRIKAENDDERRELLRFQRVDVMIAMGLAGVINLTMLVVAAAALPRQRAHRRRLDRGRARRARHAARRRRRARLRGRAARLRACRARASARYAGQVVMQGFINRRIPLFLRRAITMAPALVVLAIGVNPTDDARDLAGRAELRHPVRARADDPADPPRAT